MVMVDSSYPQENKPEKTIPLNSPFFPSKGDLIESKWQCRNACLLYYLMSWILWFIVDILILLIVEVVCTKEAVTVGDNAL